MTYSPHTSATILPLGGATPQLPESTFVAPGAVLVGDIQVGENCSFWYHAVARGDVGKIRLGDRVNVQDHSMIHMSDGKSNAEIGNDVTIGHRAVIHGATIKDRVLIGMGAIILDNAVIGEDSVVGADALVTGGKVFPPRSLILGSPAKVVKTLSDDEIAALPKGAAHYVRIAQRHKDALNAQNNE